MRQPTSRRQIRHLLKALRELQEDDFPITAQCLLSAKHLLRHKRSRHCSIVHITEDPALSPSFDTSCDNLPEYIISQLEAQKLTRKGSEEVTINPLLAFILDALPPRLDTCRGHPALFNWYSKSAHRSYLIAAHLSFEMPSISYSIQDLLNLRGNQVSDQLLSIAEKDPDLGVSLMILGLLECDLFTNHLALHVLPSEKHKKPQDASHGFSSNPMGQFGPKKPANRHKDVSTGSDEVVYRSNLRRRTAREGRREPTGAYSGETTHEPMPKPQPEQPEPPAQVSGPVVEPKHDVSRMPQEEIQEPAQEATPEVNTIDPGQPMQWKYRGRSEQEARAPEPISAPMGALAQKSEGFQRFYKAVVSPTHVRVTAGGRIVPNTRGPASPTSKRSKDTSIADNQSDKGSYAKPARPAFGLAPGQQVPAMMPQVIPGFRPGLPQVYPGFPFMPMAFGPQLAPGFAFPPGMPSPHSAPHATPVTGDGTLKEMQNSKVAEPQSDNTAGMDKNEKIKLSPPEHFDSTRPFWFNGQYLYPYQMGAMPPQMANPFMPIPMVGIPPGLSPFPGQMMPTPPNGTGTPPAGFPLGNHAVPPPHIPSHTPSMAHASSAVGLQDLPKEPPKAATAPHVSSIRPSEITKKQIASFKASLKYLEDQLQYNRHQIDEKEMEAKIKTTKDHIGRFNEVLQSQLQFEETAYPKGAREGIDIADKPEETKPSSKSPNPEPVEPHPVSKLAPAKIAPEVARKPARLRYGQLCIGESGHVNYDFSPETPEESAFEDSSKALSLPTDAALAPVFRPRGQAASWGEGEGQQRENREEMEHRMVAVGKPIAASMDEQRKSSRGFTTSSSDADASTSTHAPSSQSPVQKDQKYAVPYLLGTLPQGVDPRTAQDTDYTYVRPLTDDELRARYLYWGKAPMTARQGLPKYDGRHFYPASPVKKHTESSSGYASRSMLSRNLQKDDSDPFQSATSGHSLGGSTMGSDGFECAAVRHRSSFQTQVPEISETPEISDEVLVHPPAGQDPNTDSVSLNSFERRSDKASSKLLQAMVKKGATSSYVSPATAQGYLPQYQGYAAASLSPSVNKISPVRDCSPSKVSVSDINDLSDGGAMLSPVRDKRGENRPPVPGSLEDRFKRLVVGEHVQRGMMK